MHIFQNLFHAIKQEGHTMTPTKKHQPLEFRPRIPCMSNHSCLKTQTFL